jgi:NitT/TauT family transport system permease protein
VQVAGFRLPASSSLLLWLLLWELVGRAEVTILLPPITAIAARLVEIVPTPSFAEALAITGQAFFLGNAIAILVGVPVGVLMGRSRIADELLLPWVNLFVSAPLSALVPVLMLLFGIGQTTIVTTVFLFAVWIIVLDTRAGVRGIPPSLLEMARCYGAGPLQCFFKIHLLAALPEILTGIRMGVIRGVKGVVIGQLLVSVVGFGHLFEIYSSNFLMEHFWALLFVLFAFAVLVAEGLAWLERRVDYFAAARH